MADALDLISQRFYKLLVISRADNDKHGSSQWNCICDCGKSAIVRGYILRRGVTRSCGCLHISNHPQLKHGASRRGKKIPEYMIWRAMIDRCYRQGDKRYARYGGRGISVCDRWRHDFAAFLADVGNRPSPELSLDRINNDGNYEPGNIRWATMSQQAFNRGKRHTKTAPSASPLSASLAASLALSHPHPQSATEPDH